MRKFFQFDFNEFLYQVELDTSDKTIRVDAYKEGKYWGSSYWKKYGYRKRFKRQTMIKAFEIAFEQIRRKVGDASIDSEEFDKLKEYIKGRYANVS